jgi:(Z)-2-((N-methylformamido)methylene)-5-hydroxybutyrolactone dehydrogenase
VDRIAALATSARLGDPAAADTQIGPITTLAQKERILSFIEIAVGEGANIHIGGKSPDGPGWFIEPTILTQVDNRMRVAREEIFGPVLSVIPFDDEDEAIAVANDSPYGLAAGVWTSDMGKAFRAIERLRVGMIWINSYRAVSYMAPFGGSKRSGLGRENGQEAIYSYLQTKTVWIDPVARCAEPFVIR